MEGEQFKCQDTAHARVKEYKPPLGWDWKRDFWLSVTMRLFRRVIQQDWLALNQQRVRWNLSSLWGKQSILAGSLDWRPKRIFQSCLPMVIWVPGSRAAQRSLDDIGVWLNSLENFLWKSQTHLEPFLLFYFHISGSLNGYIFFFYFNMACDFDTQKSGNVTFLEKKKFTPPYMPFLQVHAGQFLEEIFWESLTKFHQVKICAFPNWSDAKKTSLGVILHLFDV